MGKILRLPSQPLSGSYSVKSRTEHCGTSFDKKIGLGNSHDVIVCLYRKYASASVLERNVESAVESFVSGVERQQDGVIDVPEAIMKMIYNFLATICFGKV